MSELDKISRQIAAARKKYAAKTATANKLFAAAEKARKEQNDLYFVVLGLQNLLMKTADPQWRIG